MELKQRSYQTSAKALHENSVLDRIFKARGIESSRELDYSLKSLLPPAALGGIKDAAVLLAEAVLTKAKVIIVGDFDADGATSCALAIRCLKAFGLHNVNYLVPNRFEFGYGLTPEIVGVAAADQPDLIITVDNGISSVDGVFVAQQLGISVLITDHHLPGEEIPEADVIVNPNLPGDGFASKNLAGVGVIFYVMLALRAELRGQRWFERSGIAEPNMSEFLDLVALGTVADVVHLDHNNRVLVHQGVQRVRSGKACAGIRALMEQAKRDAEKCVATDFGFAIGPRLNAAGRLDDMSIGIECLLTDDESIAQGLAAQLNELNQNRKEVERGMQLEAQTAIDQLQIERDHHQAIYVLSDEHWHQGVVGLVASKIKERVNRPVIALAPGENGEWKGSGRSVKGVHLRDLLALVEAKSPNLMSKFGGHAMAAGLSIKEENLADFEQSIRQLAETFTKDHYWENELLTDGRIDAKELNLELAQSLRDVSPWGQGFDEPIFEGEFIVQDVRTVGDSHLKMRLQLESSEGIEAICFGYHDNHDRLPSDRVNIGYRLGVNEWRGDTNLQLMIVHLQNLD